MKSEVCYYLYRREKAAHRDLSTSREGQADGSPYRRSQGRARWNIRLPTGRANPPGEPTGLHKLLALGFLFSAIHASISSAATFYVDANRPDDSGDGTTWATAKHTIQAAVDAAGVADTILVTNGVYNEGGAAITPGSSVTNRVCCDKDVILKAVSANPADTVIMGAPDPDTGGCGPKAIRCLRGHCYGPYPVVIGFTLTNGYCWNAGGVAWQDQYGGGVWGGVLSNCVVTGNTSEAIGGGLSYGNAYSCLFVGNRAPQGGGAGNGVGLFNCVVSNNYASSRGGGLYVAKVANSLIVNNTSAGYAGAIARSSVASNCIIRGNTASVGGAAGYSAGYSMKFYNCLIVENQANRIGAISQPTGLQPATLINCTVVSNRSTDSGWCAGCAGMIVATNSIIRYNINTTDGVETNHGFSADSNIGYSLTWPDVTGEAFDNGNNLSGLPYLKGGGDYSLKYRSPCVDSGVDISTLSNDIDNVTRPVDGKGDGIAAYDMGCYEYIPPPAGTLFSFQ